MRRAIHQPIKLQCAKKLVNPQIKHCLLEKKFHEKLSTCLNLLNNIRPLGSRPQRTHCVDGHVPSVGHQSVKWSTGSGCCFPLMKCVTYPPWIHCLFMTFHGLSYSLLPILSSKSRTSWVEKISSKANLGNPPDLVAIK